MFCWHPRYRLGHEQFSRRTHLDEREGDDGGLAWPWNNLENVHCWLIKTRGATVVLPLFLYEHGELRVTTDDPRGSLDPGGWDTTAIGFIYTTRHAPEGDERESEGSTSAPGLQSLTEQLRREVRVYSEQLNA